MGETRLRTLIVDDEPLARERLRTLLQAEDGVEIVGECSDGASAVRAVRERAPDLVFLDVQMPLLDGFEVVAEIGTERMPPVIFVTAYDEYAIRAFDVHALDYLLKPFERARFHTALARAKERVAGKGEPLTDRLRRLMEQVGVESREGERLVIRSRGRITFVRMADVLWFEASGNYVRIHTSDGSHLMRTTMQDLADRLRSGEFMRVSRSAIVRVDGIRELRPWGHGEYVIVLGDDTKVKSGRSYSDGLAGLVGDES